MVARPKIPRNPTPSGPCAQVQLRKVRMWRRGEGAALLMRSPLAPGAASAASERLALERSAECPDGRITPCARARAFGYG